MANNYNNLAKKYNELQLDENKYLDNELVQETPKELIHEYSQPIPPIEKEDIVKYSGHEVEGVRGNSRERSSSEFHPDIPREITLEQSEVTPVEDTAYNTYYTVETYYTVDTFDTIPYSE
jgi:hypothetical protein